MKSFSCGGRLAAACGLFAVVLVSSGCAGLAGRGAQGKVVDGHFAPSRPPALNYGPDATATCPSDENMRLTAAEIDNAKLGKPVQTDGRLCAAAQAMLGWAGDETPPESVLRFISWHFGLASPIAQVLISTLESEDSAQISQKLAEAIVNYSNNATNPRYGVATLRVSKGTTGAERGKYSYSTKVVVLLQDARVELQPVPRKLAAGGQATVSGTLAAGVQNPQILICDAQGKLDAPKATQGTTFQAEVKCGDKPGHAIVEVRGEGKNGLASLASFPIACGEELPTTVALPVAETGAADPAAQEKKIFAQVNQERTAAGLPALEYDETVAKAARLVSESEKQSYQGGAGAAAADPTEALKKVNFSSPVVLDNPGQARTADEAQARFALSAVNRCNMLSSLVTHGGIGVSPAPSTKPTEPNSTFVTELFVRKLAAIDPEALKAKLRAAIPAKRVGAGVSEVKQSATLDKIAQEYAKEIADTSGKPDKERSDTIVRPLYTAFRTVDIIAGFKNDPMEFVEEPGVIGKGNVIGIGVAQGRSAALGDNSVYVVIIVGSTK